MANHILKNDNKTLQGIMGKIYALGQFNSLLVRHLEPEIAKHCQVVKFEKNCLFVIVDSGNWATQLRFHIPDLMTKLRQHSGLEALSGIICKTRPYPSQIKSSTSKPQERTVAGLTAETSKSILESAQSIQDDKLRAILEKIAKHSQ